MSLELVIFVAIFVLTSGSVIAVMWWRMSARIAPYRDEIERNKRREAKVAGEQEVIVMDSPGSPGPSVTRSK